MKEMICIAIVLIAVLIMTVALMTMREADMMLAEILARLKADEECEDCRYCGSDWKICMNEKSLHAGENRWQGKACPEWEGRK